MKDLEQHRKRAENEVVKTPAFVNPFSDRQIIFKKKNKIRCKTVNVDYLQTNKKRSEDRLRLSPQKVDKKEKQPIIDFAGEAANVLQTRKRISLQAIESTLRMTKKYQEALNHI